MDAKTKINQYRERLDKTLASSDLTDVNILRTNVESQLLLSHEYGAKENFGVLLEKRTNELADFLGMLRSASLNEEDRDTSSAGQLNAEWKVKQDTEECRVMYREGPPGTPFHVLLVEGYLDGPVDECLCVAWETSLYKKWWPQFNYPAFKITSSQRVHQIGVDEKICTVRMKVPWPLSAREALLHYYEFEFFQEDLVIVVMKTLDDVEEDGCLYGITNYSVPESSNVVRIGVVGGLAIQKVNDERCYFRFIASLDMKIDFVSPSLINFIARQLIGNGFKLCQKAVASISKGNKDFSEALEGPMYQRIRLAGHKPEIIEVSEPEIIQAEGISVARVQTLAKLMKCDENDAAFDVAESKISTSTENVPLKSHDDNSSVEKDENERMTQFPTFRLIDSCTVMQQKKMHIRPEVDQALCTLDRVIEAVRELRMGKTISSNARQSSSEAVQHKHLETPGYEQPATSRHSKSGFTAEEGESSISRTICIKAHQEASLHSSASEITTRPMLNENITNNIPIVSEAHSKVSRQKNRKSSRFCWRCNSRHR